MNIQLLLIYVWFCIVFSVGSNKQYGCPSDYTCTTPECMQISERILQSLNESVNPCDNFYSFACGGYLENHSLRDDQDQISHFLENRNLAYNQLKEALEELPDEKNPKIFNIAKDLYKSCMNTKRIDELGLQNVKEFLKKLGGWPVAEGNQWNEIDWKDVTYKFRKYGLPTGYFLSIRIIVHNKNSSKKYLSIDENQLITNRINLFHGFQNTVMIAYYRFLVKIAVLCGADPHNAEIEIKQSLEFLMNIGKLHSSDLERKNLTKYSHKMTIKELQQQFPFLNWTEYINNIIAVPQIILSEEDVVDVANLKFLTELDELLRVTSKRVHANYAISLLFITKLYALSEEIRTPFSELYKEVLFINLPPRWMICVEIVTDSIGIGTSALCVRKYLNENIKDRLTKLVFTLQEELLRTLKKTTWMDIETKLRAISKAKSLKLFISYPNELMDDSKLNEYYRDLNCSGEFLELLLCAQKFNIDTFFLPGANNMFSWLQYIPTLSIGAFYLFAENAIVLPAATSQGVIFGIKELNYINYGSMGYIISHELTHGFDKVGKQFDENRELNDWWTASSTQAYLSRTECFNLLYSRFVVPKSNLRVNPIITQNENLADNGGIQLAYNAYQTWIERNGPEKCLPNLNYTPNQLFWISTATSWCSKETLEHIRTEMVSSHPPQSFRILGIMQNSPNFSKDFNCPIGSKMNPILKCPFW